MEEKKETRAQRMMRLMREYVSPFQFGGLYVSYDETTGSLALVYQVVAVVERGHATPILRIEGVRSEGQCESKDKPRTKIYDEEYSDRLNDFMGALEEALRIRGNLRHYEETRF